MASIDAAEGAFQDSARAAVSLVSEGTLGEWPQRRFPPNIGGSGAGEDDLVGQAGSRSAKRGWMSRLPSAAA